MPPRYYERDTSFIPAHDQPSTLLDLMLGRRIDADRALRGSGLFYDDILTGRRSISPQQYLALVDNARRLLPGEDGSFLFGQRIWPGHYGAASQALRHAATVRDALDLLARRHALLSPLATPRLWRDDRYVWLYWTDGCGAAPQWRFLAEAACAGVVALCREISGQRLPWEFFFRHERPRHVEQYWVHLGRELRFAQPLDLMRLPRHCELQACPVALPTVAQVAAQQSEEQAQALGADASFLDRVYDHLRERVCEAPSLEQVAQAFGVSPATLKRKLGKHGTGFQEQYDQVRMHVALQLFLVRGCNNEQVADYLHFHDAANFRRSFKRWTGHAPSALRPALEGAGNRT